MTELTTTLMEPAGRPEPVRIHVRWLIRRDMEEVTAISAASSLPWSAEDFCANLRQRNCIGMVAELGERVVGFMLYELHKRHLELLNFCVHPDFRRREVGTQMVLKLASKLSSHRRTRVEGVVRETDMGVLLFLRRRGFLATQVLRGHYEDTGEDGYRMAYGVPEGAEEEECQE